MKICLYTKKRNEPMYLVRSFNTLRATRDYILTVYDELKEQGYNEILLTRRVKGEELMYKNMPIK